MAFRVRFLVTEQVAVRVEQSFDFQNLLQFGKRPPVLIDTPLGTVVLLRQEVRIVREPFVPADVGRGVYRTLPSGLPDVEREACRERQHVVAETVHPAIPVEVLERGHAGEFQHGTYPFGNTVLPLYAVRNRKRIVTVGSVVQQPDTREGCETPAHLFLLGIPATKHIP